MTWGAVSWLLQFEGPHLFFEGEPEDPVFSLGVGTYFEGTLSMIPFRLLFHFPPSLSLIYLRDSPL